jgi:hypothetical protein
VVGRTVVVVVGALDVVGAGRVVVVVVGLEVGAGVVVADVVEVVGPTVDVGAGPVDKAAEGSSRFRTAPARATAASSPTNAATRRSLVVIARVVGRHAGVLKKELQSPIARQIDQPSPRGMMPRA